MSKRELFEKSLKAEAIFRNYEMTDLTMIGDFLGRHPEFLKNIFKTLQTKEDTVSFKPMTGAPVTVTVNNESREIVINRIKFEIVFSFDNFIRFMSLIDICYMEIFPIGSIVKLDLDFMSESIKESVKNGHKGFQVMIVSQKVPLEDNENIFADYAVTLWPIGLQKYSSPFLITNLMIENVVHKGMSNDTERDYVNKIREKVINHKMSSLMYLTKDEIKKTAVNSTKEGDNDAYDNGLK